MSSVDNTGRVKILKRQAKPDERDVDKKADCSSANGQESVATDEKDRLYESARAQILGEDFDSAAQEASYQATSIPIARKAIYRGRDHSEVDPDYVREPEIGIAYFPVMYPMSHPSIGPSVQEQYPSLGEAYRQSQPPRRP